MYKKEFIGKTPDYSPNSPKLKIGGKNYARNHFAQPDEHWLGYAIFLCAYLSNVSFSLYYNIKILLEPFSKEKLINSGLKIAAFVCGLTLLCVAITTLPLFADMVGWEIPAEYVDIFSNLVIIGAVLMVSCKYITEAFTKFKAILDATKEDKSYDEVK